MVSPHKERRVRLNWVFRHLAFRANEAADESAREATSKPAVLCMVHPSMQQAKVLSPREARNMSEDRNRQRERILRQAAWYGRANIRQPLRPPNNCQGR